MFGCKLYMQLYTDRTTIAKKRNRIHRIAGLIDSFPPFDPHYFSSHSMCPLSHNPMARRVGDSNTASNSVAARRTCTSEVSCPYRLASRLQNACKGRGGLNRFTLNVCHGFHMCFRRTAPCTIPTDPRPKGNRLTPTGGVPRLKTSAAPTSASVTRKRKTTAAQNVAVDGRPLHHMHS